MLPRIRVPAPILVSSPSPEMDAVPGQRIAVRVEGPAVARQRYGVVESEIVGAGLQDSIVEREKAGSDRGGNVRIRVRDLNGRAVGDRRAARIGVLPGQNRCSAAGDREHRGRGGADEQVRERLRIRRGDGDDPGRRRRPGRVGQDGHRQDRVVVERRQRTREPVGVGKAIGVRHRGAAVVQIGGVGVVEAGVARLRGGVGVAQRQRRGAASIRLVAIPGPGGRGANRLSRHVRIGRLAADEAEVQSGEIVGDRLLDHACWGLNRQ